MIFKSASQLSPTVEVAIDNVPVNYMTLQQIVIEERSKLHNMAVLTFAGLDPQLIHQYLDVPITFSIELRDRSPYTFHGYISYLEPEAKAHNGVVNGSPFQTTKVYCFGTSYKMKSTVSKIWENVTIGDIAVSLGEKYKFSVSVPNNTYRFPRLAQSGKSDWEFLSDSCGQLGYDVLMDGTHLHIWDAYDALSRNISYSVLLTLRGSRGDASPQPGQILSFEGRIGSVTPDGDRNPDTIYMLDKSGQLLAVSNNESLDSSGLATALESQFTNVLTINADSYDMANRLVTGELRKKFPTTATVEVVSDPSIRPGGIVSISEYDTEFDGFWYVQSVKHEMTQSVMRTFLELGRDSMGTTPTTIRTAQKYQTPPTPALIGSSWVSSQNYVNVY